MNGFVKLTDELTLSTIMIIYTDIKLIDMLSSQINLIYLETKLSALTSKDEIKEITRKIHLFPNKVIHIPIPKLDNP